MPFDGTKLDDVTKLLIEGRERIEQGWCQHKTRERGAVCVIGALHDGRSGVDEPYYAAMRRLGRAVGLAWSLLPLWNDAPGRTKDEVLAAFDKAIAGE